jgi:hypothetical protein
LAVHVTAITPGYPFIKGRFLGKRGGSSVDLIGYQKLRLHEKKLLVTVDLTKKTPMPKDIPALNHLGYSLNSVREGMVFSMHREIRLCGR